MASKTKSRAAGSRRHPVTSEAHPNIPWKELARLARGHQESLSWISDDELTLTGTLPDFMAHGHDVDYIAVLKFSKPCRAHKADDAQPRTNDGDDAATVQ